MITVTEATEQILGRVQHFGATSVSLTHAWGRILAEPLVADRDFPPFTRVAMDGIAIPFEAFAKGKRQFSIQGMQAAGAPSTRLANHEACIEVMTGAILPQGADTVIRNEDLDISEGIATILTEDVRQGQNAHLQGTDRRRDDVIVPAGTRIGAAELGVAATVGKAQLLVHTLPRVALIATGDELVAVDAQPLPHQIRMSNIYALQGLFHAWHIPTELMHVRDDRYAVAQQLGAALKQYDVLVMTGGVSAGKFDHMPAVLEELGISKIFDKVQQRPGKPFWFGAANGKTVFALPGNPVPAFMCATRYIQPWLRACFGMPPSPPSYAVLDEDYSFKSNLTLFLQVKLSLSPDGRWIARPEAGKGSGDLANLVRADGFLELPTGQQQFRKGASYPLWLYRYLPDN